MAAEARGALPGLPGGWAELDRHLDAHGVPDIGRTAIRRAVEGEPVRRVGGGGGNVIVRFASRRMGCVIQAESRTLELPFVHRCEHDPSVVLYLCQPLKLAVRIVDAAGRRRRIYHTPDFLVLDGDGFSLVECKTIDALEGDAARPAPRYVRDGDRWRWPAAEEAAAELGMRYQLFTSAEVNPLWDRNIKYLSDFLAVPVPDGAPARSVLDAVRSARSIRIDALLALPGVAPECVWGLIAHGAVWCDLDGERVFEPHGAWAHDSEARMRAHGRAPAADPERPDAVALVRIEPEATLEWDGVPWRVLNSGAKAVTLECLEGYESVVRLPNAKVERLVETGALRGGDRAESDTVAQARDALFRQASEQDLGTALARLEVVTHLREHGKAPRGVSERTARRYQRWAAEGERRYGSDLAGLVRRRGRRPGTPDLGEAQAEVLREVVEAYASDTRAGRISAAYARLVALCAERGVHPPPSEDTLRRAIRRLPVATLEARRRGRRAAYQAQGPLGSLAWSDPTQGDRAFEIGHVDHTPLDVRVVSGKSGAVLGSVWITLMIDACSRMPLAHSLTFDAPSRVAVMSVLGDCVRRHRRLPDTLVLDQGAEFNSVDVETALAALGVHKRERPAAKARFGAVIERVFGTVNSQFVHELLGSTPLLRLGRGLSASHHPERTAAWTLATLDERCERYLYEVYPGLVHQGLGAKPREVFERSVAASGARFARRVPYDESLRLLLALTVRGGTRRVRDQTIHVMYLRYWHDMLGDGDVAGTEVPVKLDAADCSIAFAWVRGRWITCRLAEGRADLAGRSWKQIRLVVQELQAAGRVGRAARAINAEAIGRYLRETDVKGDLLRQVLRDAEPRRAWSGPQAQEAPEPPGPPELRLATVCGSPVGPIARPPPQAPDSDVCDDIDFDDLEVFDGG